MNAPYPNETSPLSSKMAEERQTITDTLDWSDPKLARIVRLRLLTDRGFPVWDVNYCYGRTIKGELVRVQLPFDQLPKRDVKGAILRAAKADGVFAKGLGLFDPDVISKLW